MTSTTEAILRLATGKNILIALAAMLLASAVPGLFNADPLN